MTDMVARLDDYGKGAWISVMVLGFILSGRLGWRASPSFYGADVWDAESTEIAAAGKAGLRTSLTRRAIALATR